MENPTSEDLIESQEVNVRGTEQWLAWCEACGVTKFVYFSTIKAGMPSQRSNGGYVQCGGDVSKLDSFGIKEDLLGPGDTPYGKSKWEAEQRVIQWAKKSSHNWALIVRPAVVYGPGNTANIYAMVNALANGRFFLVGQNDNVKSIVSLRNLTAAVLHLVQRMKPGVEIFNITDEQSYSVRELAAMVAQLLDVKWTERSLPVPLAKGVALFGDAFSKLTGKGFPLNSTRLRALLETSHFSCEKLLSTGFRHLETTEEGLAKMITWYKAEHRRSG